MEENMGKIEINAATTVDQLARIIEDNTAEDVAKAVTDYIDWSYNIRVEYDKKAKEFEEKAAQLEAKAAQLEVIAGNFEKRCNELEKAIIRKFIGV